MLASDGVGPPLRDSAFAAYRCPTRVFVNPTRNRKERYSAAEISPRLKRNVSSRNLDKSSAKLSGNCRNGRRHGALSYALLLPGCSTVVDQAVGSPSSPNTSRKNELYFSPLSQAMATATPYARVLPYSTAACMIAPVDGPTTTFLSERRLVIAYAGHRDSDHFIYLDHASVQNSRRLALLEIL